MRVVFWIYSDCILYIGLIQKAHIDYFIMKYIINIYYIYNIIKKRKKKKHPNINYTKPILKTAIYFKYIVQ